MALYLFANKLRHEPKTGRKSLIAVAADYGEIRERESLGTRRVVKTFAERGKRNAFAGFALQI